MPTNNSPESLDWNEENLDRVVSNLYQEIETDEAFRQRLMADPFDVLSSRIAIPESYRGGIFIAEKGQDTMMLNIPARNVVTSDALPEGTSEVSPQPDYQLLCTPIIPW